MCGGFGGGDDGGGSCKEESGISAEDLPSGVVVVTGERRKFDVA